MVPRDWLRPAAKSTTLQLMLRLASGTGESRLFLVDTRLISIECGGWTAVP